MSKAFLKAKEKYDAVINDAGRGDWYCRTNRYGATKHPKGCHEVNKVERVPTRRASSASAGSASSSGSKGTGQQATIKEWSRLKQWMNRPAV
ncbi:uncharacterized protein BCR38DRAFT_481897 [Pseudomassariella vexata]|uniref:Uncharacterized protein n=1 Tax=Pseudomassariella vexata TaxID=1141098 RepID=A0A1Y2EAW5_9PEZI|nr:uncharacterized protein BCR38DRAFT_481897 [Pseudomassariella vexata]ORY68406.1 hypothetical protein BCR38DRAFT_481897 [Pseudomassariella vexata]